MVLHFIGDFIAALAVDQEILSIGELSSALCASSLKNFSAVSGCHSLSEAMLLFSLSLLGLVRSLHCGTSLSKVLTSRTKFASAFAYSYESRVYYSLKFSVCQ